MINTAGGISFSQNSSGVTLNDERPRHKLFKITSGTNPYAALEVFLNDSDGTKDDAARLEFDAATKMLWELRGNASVPVNSYVVAHPNPDSDGWVFVYEAGAVGYCTNLLSNVCPIYAWIKFDGSADPVYEDPGEAGWLRVVIGMTEESTDCETGDVTCTVASPDDCCTDGTTSITNCCDDTPFTVPNRFMVILQDLTGAAVGMEPIQIDGTGWDQLEPPDADTWVTVNSMFTYDPLDGVTEDAFTFSVLYVECIESGFRITLEITATGEGAATSTITGLNSWSYSGGQLTKDFTCGENWNPNEQVADVSVSGGDPAYDYSFTVFLKGLA